MNAKAIPVHTGQVNCLESYIGAIQRVPMLNQDEEYELAARFIAGQDRQAAERLVVSHLRLVVSIARGYLGYGLPFADLIQEGTVGLMRAVKRFDPERRIRLAGFAAYHIRCEIQEFVLKNWRLVKVATTKAQRKLFFNLRSAKQTLGWMGEEQIDEMALSLDVKSSDVREMESRLVAQELSLSSMGNEDDQGSAYDLADERYLPERPIEARDRARMAIRLKTLVSSLDERSREIIELRWLGENKTTLEELAIKFGVSKERVRQLEAKALQNLRGALIENSPSY